MNRRQPCRQLPDVLRGPHARDNVLARSVGKEVSRRPRGSRHLIATERDPGARRLPFVSEHHLLDIDRGTPLFGDAVDASIGRGSRAIPRLEYGPDSAVELCPRIRWKVINPRNVATSCCNAPVSSSVSSETPRSRLRLAISRSKYSPSTPTTTFPYICTNRRNESHANRSLDVLAASPATRRVVQPQVKHRVEHPRPRLACARAHRYQQRVLWVAERLPTWRSSLASASSTSAASPSADGAASEIGHARLSRDRKAGRHTPSPENPCHLRDIRALATEQLTHLTRTLREVVYPPCVGHGSHLRDPRVAGDNLRDRRR